MQRKTKTMQALARLNEREAYDRAYRLRVASMCAIAHEELPKNERVKPEEVRSRCCHLDMVWLAGAGVYV